MPVVFRPGLVHNLPVPPRQRIAAALLLLTVVLPPLLGLGAFALTHDHADGRQGHAARELALARLLAHGHGHDEGVPEHEHELLPAPPPSLHPPQPLLATAASTLPAPLPEAPILAAALRSWSEARPTSAGPPLLQLHRILLI